MAKIQKIDLHLGQRIVNPFKTTRSSSTNPFKYQDFEGNTIDPLVCADVLVSMKSKQSKLKMISASVAGSITKLHSNITEPIVKFVKRIGSDLSSAWDYAKNTNISDVKGFRTISNTLNMDIADVGRGIKNSISDSLGGIGKGISNKFSAYSTSITELGHGISDKWTSLIGKIHHSRINKDTTVDELRAMWEAEIASSVKEAA